MNKESNDQMPEPIPHIKGVPATTIINMLSEGSHYQDIVRRFRNLDYGDIDKAIRFRNRCLVPARLAQGRTPKEVAQEFGFTEWNVSNIMRKVERDKELKAQWGGLSYRSVKAIKKNFGFTNFEQFVDKLPTVEELLMTRNIGKKTLDDITRVLAEHSITIQDPITNKIRPVYHTKINHMPKPPYDTSLPRLTRETAKFFHAIYDVGCEIPADEEISAQIPCMASPQRRWCLGILMVSRRNEPWGIHWRCPVCGLSGVLVD